MLVNKNLLYVDPSFFIGGGKLGQSYLLFAYQVNIHALLSSADISKTQLYRNTISVSNSLDLHLAHRYVGPDLVLNSLQRLLEDAPIR